MIRIFPPPGRPICSYLDFGNTVPGLELAFEIRILDQVFILCGWSGWGWAGCYISDTHHGYDEQSNDDGQPNFTLYCQRSIEN